LPIRQKLITKCVILREGLEIKNLFTVFENKVEVQLRHGRTFKCDIEDLNIVEEYVWGLKGRLNLRLADKRT